MCINQRLWQKGVSTYEQINYIWVNQLETFSGRIILLLFQSWIRVIQVFKEAWFLIILKFYPMGILLRMGLWNSETKWQPFYRATEWHTKCEKSDINTFFGMSSFFIICYILNNKIMFYYAYKPRQHSNKDRKCQIY
jgi:hypothetical protein